MRNIWIWAALLLVAGGLFVGMLRPVWGEEASRVGPAEDVLYEDASGQSSAKITQVMPDSSKNLLTLESIRRVRIKHDILIVEWGNTLTTLLPKQYITEMTINKRQAATAPR